MFREYSASQQGRWISPDPAGLAVVDPSNPQSWNRYAYVFNNPANSIDVLGLGTCLGPDGPYPCDNQENKDPGAPDGSSDNADRPMQDRPGNQFAQYVTVWLAEWMRAHGGGGHFTLGLRNPNQTYNQCMLDNAGNYSLLGVADFALNANGQIADNPILGSTPASNQITNIYNLAAGSLTSLLQTGPRIVGAGMGTVVTSGRRSSSIMSLNLPGTPGGPKGGTPALGPAPSNAARASDAAYANFKLAIDTGFFLAEGAGCLGPAEQ